MAAVTNSMMRLLEQLNPIWLVKKLQIIIGSYPE
jgi:hypothetical protein